MEFGRVLENELDKIDFSLPKEPSFNNKVLPGNKFANPKVYFGCAKWGRKEWIGKIYPKGTKDANFLDHYVHHYNAIELNATHYQLYGPAAIEKWATKAKGLDFKFCPKITKSISHYGTFENKQALTDDFLKGVLAFGDHLGPIFLQVSDIFSPKRKTELFTYLRLLPTDLSFFLEVRNPERFVEKEKPDLFETLHNLKIGAIITDTAGRRDCAHMYLTIPKAFIRYVGNSLHPTDYTRCDEWIKRIKYWLDNGLKELYFFMHVHDEAFSPELTVYLIDKLNAICDLQLLKPKFVDSYPKQKLLF